MEKSSVVVVYWISVFFSFLVQFAVMKKTFESANLLKRNVRSYVSTCLASGVDNKPANYRCT